MRRFQQGQERPPGSVRPQPTIVCIDDDPDMTRSIAMMLSNFDVRVLCDCCGRLGAWDVFQRRADLIITDVRMPDGDGGFVLEVLKSNARTASIPVIVLTGQRDPQLPGRMKSLGAASVLLKPVHYLTLLAEIRRFITLPELDWAAVDSVGVHWK